MIKWSATQAIVYNSEREVIVLWKVKEEDGFYYMDFYKNQEHLTNEDIEDNLKKSLSLKDKLEVAWKKSIFNRSFNGDAVFAGKIWRENYFDKNNIHHREIFDTIRKSLSCAKFYNNLQRTWELKDCSPEEIKAIVTNLHELEIKHKQENENNRYDDELSM